MEYILANSLGHDNKGPGEELDHQSQDPLPNPLTAPDPSILYPLPKSDSQVLRFGLGLCSEEAIG